jgi:hypothetical protein
MQRKAALTEGVKPAWIAADGGLPPDSLSPSTVPSLPDVRERGTVLFSASLAHLSEGDLGRAGIGHAR